MKRSIFNAARLFIAFMVLLIMIACTFSPSTFLPKSVPLTATLKASEPTLTETVLPSATPKPSPLPTFTLESPKVLPDAKLYVVDLKELKENAPADINEQLFSYSPGAGGGGWEMVDYPDTIFWVEPYEKKVLNAIPSNALSWLACNFSTSSRPTANLKLPDGSTVPWQDDLFNWETRNLYSCVQLSFLIEPGIPLGLYTMEIQQGDTTIEDAVILGMPSQPVTGQYYKKTDEGNCIRSWFSGFQPEETVELSIFCSSFLADINQLDPNSSILDNPEVKQLDRSQLSAANVTLLINKLTIQADQYGSFQVEKKFTLPGCNFIYLLAQGKVSGYATEDELLLKKCGEALPSRLQMGAQARIRETSDLSSPRFDDLFGPQLPSGSIVTVLIGPVCWSSPFPEVKNEEYWYWISKSSDGTIMNVPECDVNGYVLEPINP